jgi:hypothetical protein
MRNPLIVGLSCEVVDLLMRACFADAGLGCVSETRLAGDDVSSGTWSLGAG